MRNTLRALGALAVFGLAACVGKTPEPKPLPAPPSIKSFTADKTRITSGESATLTFAAENATEVELLNQAGDRVELSGDAGAGSATVTPTQTAFYVLKVSGEGGRATAFVQIAVDEDLKEVFLVAVPSEIDSGESAQLLWSAFHAASAKLVTGGGQETVLDAAKGSGVIEVNPARSETYNLVASGVAAAEMTATAPLAVRPVLTSATMLPGAAQVGETIEFTWATAGAVEVALTEDTFGELHKVSFPADEMAVDGGSFTWTVPDMTPANTPVTLGMPLRFTLTVKQSSPDATVTKVWPSFVGTGPRISSFEAPATVTEGTTFNIRWSTLNASRLQVFANGALLFEPLPRDQATVASGALTLAAPLADTTYEVVATGYSGITDRRTQLVKVVKAPVITEFTVPASINNAGDAANISWKTANATSVTVTVKSGPSIFSSVDPQTVAAGTASVLPGVKTTLVLEARNAAGEAAVMEKTVDVSNPGTFSASPAPVTPGETVTVSWALDAATTAQVFGDYTQLPIKNNPGIDFVDLETHVGAKAITFADGDNAVAKLPLTTGFRFPLAGTTEGDFWVSTNGFVSFSDIGAQASNVSLDSTSALPAVIAPFWDDLVLGATSEVLYLVEGTKFPRRLIVQWSKVQLVQDTASELTFQVQLHETGEVRFGYKTLTGTGAGGESASIGWRASAALNGELATSGAATVTTGDELVFFNSGLLTGQYAVPASRSGVFTIVAKQGTGDYVLFANRVTVIPPQAVEVSEIMVAPEATATAGQWVELFNTTSQEIDLSGAKLATASMTEYVLEEGTVIPAGGYLVLGQSTDGMQNGGATVDYEWGALAPSAAVDDSLVLSAVNPVSQLSWTAAGLTAGTSVQAPEKAIDSTGVGITCARTKTFGANGAIGTPKAANESCFEYAATPIPVKYRDISGSGVALFTPGSSNQDSVYTSIDVSAAPIPYFGTQQNTVNVSSNGFASFGTLSSDWTINDLTPDSSPGGTVAVFWDDLDNVTGGSGNVFAKRFNAAEDPTEPRAHWVVQWHHFTHYTFTPANEDDLNFQVKFFDDGSIEYHYAEMVSGTSSNYAQGSSATVWLERLDGTAAVPIGLNQPVLQPHTAYRFTPNP